MRDATEKFLDHVDFVRGDRVAFVTFDRTAYLIDPDGEKITDPKLGTIAPAPVPDALRDKALIDAAQAAYLRDYVTFGFDPMP